VRCEPCDMEMNHHAVRLREPSSREEAARVDPDLGGIEEEIHTCPGCGHSKKRERDPSQHPDSR